jgi:hypothetical protein
MNTVFGRFMLKKIFVDILFNVNKYLDFIKQYIYLKIRWYFFNQKINNTIIKFNLLIKSESAKINNLEVEIKNCSIKDIKKTLRTQKMLLGTKLHTLKYEHEINLQNIVIDYMFELEKMKINNFHPKYVTNTIRKLYLILATKTNHTNARYIKLPIEWMNLGIYAGILEDLVVIMRTASQINISNDHLISLDVLKTRFIELNDTAQINIRFPFINRIFMYDSNMISKIIRDAIKFQGCSKRIGYYIDISPDTHIEYLYAIQGMYGNVPFDKRVIKQLTSDNLYIPFAIHFTKYEIADAIFNSRLIGSTKFRANGKEIIPGTICVFNRPIHAITSIQKEQIDGSFIISDSLKDIRTRMTTGISDKIIKKKYEAGLVIDLKKLVSSIPNSVFINEIGTLLVLEDIPRDCIIAHLYSKSDIDRFWRI